MSPSIQPFFDPVTGTVSYVLSDPVSRMAAVIDPVLDYAPASGRTDTSSADRILGYLHDQQLTQQWILETHAHADHLSAAAYLRQRAGGHIAIGASIRQVQGVFKKLYNLGADFQADGSQFDQLFADGDTFMIGTLQARALFVPGHTPADMAYQAGDAVFTGDTLFMPDVGTARTDFPGGDARTLYRSIQRLLALPDATRLFACHDYPPDTRPAAWESSVAQHKAHNIHVRDGITEDAFVALRQARDATLDAPTLILPALQVNIRAGQLPPAEDNGTSYLKIPLNALSSAPAGTQAPR
ncbi:MBL fold metallo-hydrolase [Castellaniella sp.]|uniref:MBL fold metallo-hydrolase n=1 Tax=Castellaniella sp. TaxID=1955812 RepID=UPI002AFF7EC6|nr:MBL fold metallo-hydrolase [Castellaniella sp.]